MTDRKTYWEKRIEQLLNSQDKRNDKFMKSMGKEYSRLEESLKKDIASYYAKYGKDDVIEYRKLVQDLTPGERDLLYQDYETFAKKHPQYQHLMPIRESIYKLNRLEGLQLSTQLKALELGAAEHGEFEKLLAEAYEKGYLSSMGGLQNAPSFFSINQLALQQTIHAKWINGENFSDRIWKNKRTLVNALNNEIRDGIIRGNDYKQMVKTLSYRTGVGQYATKRLVITESAFVMAQANKQAFMDAGVEKYEVSAVLDRRTSKICKGLDGQQFYFKDAKVGINYSPFHCFCRTTQVPIEEYLPKNVETAIKMINEAKQYEPKITSDLMMAANMAGVYLKGLDYRLKSEESLARKLKGEGNKKIRDVLRYTVIADPDNAVDSYDTFVDMLDTKGYNETVVKNYWINDSNPYNGINTFVKNQDGYEFEIQYHTEQSFTLKDGKLHELYEKARVLDPDSKEFKELEDKMFLLSDQLPKPKNIKDVK